VLAWVTSKGWPVQRFRDYEVIHGVTIRPGWIVNHVSLTITLARTTITYSHVLDRRMALLGVTMALGIIIKQWPGSRFRFRFPLPDDGLEMTQAAVRVRRDYRIVERWARRELLPNAMLDQAEREGWEDWQVLEACGLDWESYRKRVQEWRGLLCFA
jgi:hypothetical protein